MFALETMQLEGTLSQFPLAELLGLAVHSVVTGVLEIGPRGSMGRIFCRDGRIYHAETPEYTGFDAICHLFESEAEDASFCFVSGILTDDRSIWENSVTLIARAEEQAHQWRDVRQHIRDLNWVPVLHDHSQAASVQLSEQTWPIMAAIDGQRSIAQIALELGYIPLEVCRALCELLEQGLITFKQPQPLNRQSTAAAPPGLLKRMARNLQDGS